MRIFQLLVGLLVASAAWAQPISEYASPVPDATWRAEGSPIYCALSHSIRHFGEARFQVVAGGHLRLTLNSSTDVMRRGHVHLAALDAPWRSATGRHDLGWTPAAAQ